MKTLNRNLTVSPKLLNSITTMKKNRSIIQWMLTAALAVSAGNASAVTKAWTGASGTTTNWSTAGNWSASGAPASTDDVVLNDGGNTNAAGTVNNVVDSSFAGSVKSLSYANTNGFHTTLIAPGKALIMNGSGANFNVGTGSSNSLQSGNLQVYTTITGSGGSLLITNGINSLFILQSTVDGLQGTHKAVLDLSGLDYFGGKPGTIRVGLGNTSTRQGVGQLIMAKTNTLTLTRGFDPDFIVGDAKTVLEAR